MREDAEMPLNYAKIEMKPELMSLADNYRIWRRLEPRTREDDFTRSVQARVHDPLWMLARQWQLGEFKGEDAGSPVKTVLSAECARLANYKPKEYGIDANASRIDRMKPLETAVEQRTTGLDVRTRAMIGLELERELTGRLGPAAIAVIAGECAFDALTEEERLSLDCETADFADVACARKVIDGKKLADSGLLAKDPVFPPVFSEIPEDVLSAALKAVTDWCKALNILQEADADSAWSTDTFDYSCCVSAPAPGNAQYVLEADEYTGGSLDWSSFTVLRGADKKLTPVGTFVDTIDPPTVHEYTPVSAGFKGKPLPRWWAFEDAKVDYGDLKVKTTDIGKLLLMEFALVYGNDWYQIPYPLAIGSLCKIVSLDVYNVFGEKTTVPRAGAGEGDCWQRWDMFGLSYKAERQLQQQDASDYAYASSGILFLPPTLGRSEETPALEEIRFLRDENANKVWAVEHTYENGLGASVSATDYWNARNARVSETSLRRNLNVCIDIAGQRLPQVIGKLANDVEGIPYFALLQTETGAVGDMMAFLNDIENGSRDMSEMNGLETLSIEVLRGRTKMTALHNALDSLDDIRLKSALRRMISVCSAVTENIEPVVVSLEKGLKSKTLESVRTHFEIARKNLASLLDPTALTDEQKELLGIRTAAAANPYPAYRLMSRVPENWIPYIPVHTGEDDRSVVFVRGAVARGVATGDFEPVSRILSEATGDGRHRLAEETIARHGLSVSSHIQRTRWIDGSTCVWRGIRKGPGKGEGSSGLRFDYLIQRK